MKITILTLFPNMFTGPFDQSIVKNAKARKLIEIEYIDIRNFGVGKHKTVDDTEYGGGIGMVMKVDVLHSALQAARCLKNDNESKKGIMKKCNEKIALLSATGKTYNQQKAKTLSQLDHLILICGHYEGVDERIKNYIDEEISIGDYILTGGEIPAMIIIDSVCRLIKGVLPEGATEDESFSTVGHQTLLEYPHYTNPREYDGEKVPEILLSGNHPEIKKWRQKKAEDTTRKLRPNLLKSE